MFSRKFSRLILFSVFLALLIFTHHSSLNHPFLHDDVHSIRDNPHVRSLSNVGRFFVDASTFSVDPYTRMYRPALLTSYALNWAVSGSSPWSWRFFNMFLHALNCVLLVILLSRWIGERPSIAAGLLFLLHPMAGRTFSLVSSRSALLLTLSVLLGLLAYRRIEVEEKRLRRWRWLMLSLAAMLLGLMSVSAAVVVFPGFVLLMELSIVKKESPWRYLRVLPFVALSLVYLFFRQRLMGSAFGEEYVRPVSINAALQLKVLYVYLKMTLFPIDPPLFYPVLEPSGWLDTFVILAVLSTAIWLGLGLYLLRRGSSRATGLMLVWPLVAAFPYAAVPLNVPVAEHHFYASLAGLAGLAASFFSFYGRGSRRLATAFVIIIGVLLGTLAHHRDRTWEGDFALAANAVRHDPESPRAWNELGNAYTAHSRYNPAIEAFKRAISLDPGLLRAYYNLGITYFYMERYPDAVRELMKYRRISPHPEHTQYEDGIIGMALARMGKPAQALTYLNRALELHPGRREVLLEKTRALLQLDRPAEAIAVSDILLGSSPKDTEALLWRARARLRAGDTDGAQSDVSYLRGIGVRSPEVLILEASILRRKGELEEAIEFLNDATDQWPQVGPLWSLKGMIFEQMHRPEDALAAYRRAIGLELPPHRKAVIKKRIKEIEENDER